MVGMVAKLIGHAVSAELRKARFFAKQKMPHSEKKRNSPAFDLYFQILKMIEKKSKIYYN